MWVYLTPPLLLFLEVGFPFGLLVPGGDTLLLFLGALAGEGKLALFPLLPLRAFSMAALRAIGSSSGPFWGMGWGMGSGGGLARP
jgi:membrane-associated protein